MRRAFTTLRVGSLYVDNSGDVVKIVAVDCKRCDLPKWFRVMFGRERYIDEHGRRFRPCGKLSYLGDSYGDLMRLISPAEGREIRYARRVANIFSKRDTLRKAS